MDHLQSWLYRTWGAAVLTVPLLIGAVAVTEEWITRIGIVLITSLILWDARHRSVSQFLHPWLFFLLALLGFGLMHQEISPAVTAGCMIAGSVALLLAVPYRLSTERPSRSHLALSILFAELLLMVSLFESSSALQAAVTVAPIFMIEELLNRPRGEWWSKAAPFAILTLILLVALLIRDSYSLT